MSRPTILFALTAAALITGCGGTEPISAITRAAPQLSLPVLEGTLSSVQRYSQASSPVIDGLRLNLSQFGQNVLAPAGGIVTAVDNTLGAAVVYIYHSPHLTSRISQLQTVSVQAGSIAQTGSVLGLSSNTTPTVHFTVYYDGAIVCPQSYFTAAAQAVLVTRARNFALCD